MSQSRQCEECAKEIPGNPYVGNLSGSELDAIRGRVCPGCGVTYCNDCARRVLAFSRWHGYDRSVCPKCGTVVGNQSVVLGSTSTESDGGLHRLTGFGKAAFVYYALAAPVLCVLLSWIVWLVATSGGLIHLRYGYLPIGVLILITGVAAFVSARRLQTIGKVHAGVDQNGVQTARGPVSWGMIERASIKRANSILFHWIPYGELIEPRAVVAIHLRNGRVIRIPALIERESDFFVRLRSECEKQNVELES